MSDHLVHFYDDDALLTAAVSKFLADGIAGGEQLIAIATEAHRRELGQRLEARGIDVTRVSASGQLLFLDASTVLSKIMRHGEPVRALFELEVGRLIEQRAGARSDASQRAKVRAYGEMVDVLWRQGFRTAAIQLEELWTELQTRFPFRLLCAYSNASLHKESLAFQRVCALHTHVVSEDGSHAVDPDLRAATLQPEHAAALASEIVQRLEVERAMRHTLGEDPAQRGEPGSDQLPVLVSYMKLSTITAAIAGAVSRPQVFDALVDDVAKAVDASSAALWLLDEDGQTARLVHSFAYSDAAKRAFDRMPLDATPSVPALDVMRAGEPLWIASQDELVRRYPHLRESVTEGRAYRVSCLPLTASGRTLGALALTIEEARETSEEERAFLLLVARYASQAVERLQALEAERSSRAQADAAARRLAQLNRFAQAVVAANRVEQVFDAAFAAIESVLGTTRAAILTLDGERVMRFSAWRGLSDEYRAAVEGHSPWEPDVIAPEPVLVSDALGDAAMAAYAPLFGRERIGSLAFIPLVARGRLLGKFMVYYEHSHVYGATEIETTRTLANLLGSAIARFGAIAALEDTIRNNEVFAGVLAHDLRNPLSAIVTATQLVLMRNEDEGTLSEADVKPLGKILKASHRIARMIDQLLDFTRARSGGGIVVQPREADLAELCAQAIGELEMAHPEWTMKREVLGDPRGHWDQDRLLQVISNLIANAGQHGRSGAVVLVRLDGTQANHVRFEVHNEGTVPEAILPEIFDPFRGTRHRHTSSNGLGLGLYIVREIIRAHGGTVEVASSEASGTTFSIRLPRQKVPARPN